MSLSQALTLSQPSDGEKDQESKSRSQELVDTSLASSPASSSSPSSLLRVTSISEFQPPSCKHGHLCILRKSRKPGQLGEIFWVCPEPDNCGFMIFESERKKQNQDDSSSTQQTQEQTQELSLSPSLNHSQLSMTDSPRNNKKRSRSVERLVDSNPSPKKSKT